MASVGVPQTPTTLYMANSLLNKVANTYESAVKARTTKKSDSPTVDPKKAKEFEKGFNESVGDRLKRQYGNVKKLFNGEY